MLKRATPELIGKIKELCADSIIGTKILCYILAYGFDRDFLEIWAVEDEGRLDGVIVRFYDDITMILSEKADAEQVRSFLDMFWYKTITCSYEACQLLGFEADTVKNGFCFNGESFSDGDIKMLCEDDYSKAYKLISREIPDSFRDDREAYLSFLSDYTFRERRSLARGVCSYSNDMLTSVALTSSETENCAIISGVVCDKTIQKKGLGKRTVLTLVSLLAKENKKAFVIALNESAEGFYEHIGFSRIEKIAFVERNNHV